MKKFIRISLIVLTLQGLSGCNYLDIVPDNVATIENAFTLRTSAQKYLYTCYSYLPQHGSLTTQSPSFVGRELWPLDYAVGHQTTAQFAKGLQNASTPLLNFWEGLNGGIDIFEGIRDCNIFLENIQNVPDMEQPERDQWAAEVKFLKAYYHFFLLQLYGPIPIIRENLPIDADISEVRMRRQPVDECIDYIVELLDSAIPYLQNLPAQQINSTDYGRATVMMALGLKARVLSTAASPLFNGNPDYANYIDPELGPLFNPTYSSEKWQKAMLAAKAALDNAASLGMALYKFQPNPATELTDTTIVQLSIREAFAAREINGEVIWPNTGAFQQQGGLSPMSWTPDDVSYSMLGRYGPSLDIVELYYTNNGLPIEVDKTWDYAGRFDFKTGDVKNMHHVKLGYETVKLHFDREPRFYANVGFDGGVWYGQGKYTDADKWHLEIRAGRFTGVREASIHSPTSYYPKKPINYQSYIAGGTYYANSYMFPNMRLAELYLLFAEAANELNGPSEEALSHINTVRERADIPTVQEAWDSYSTQPGKYTTKEGLRDIIRQEIRIELNTESQVYWHLLRWKIAEDVLSKPIIGWDKRGATPEEFYQQTLIFQRTFQKRDYFMPIRELVLQQNENLLQSPRW